MSNYRVPDYNKNTISFVLDNGTKVQYDKGLFGVIVDVSIKNGDLKYLIKPIGKNIVKWIDWTRVKDSFYEIDDYYDFVERIVERLK